MIKRERERTKRERHGKDLEERVKRAFERLGYPLTPDITSNERHYNRSVRMRKAIYTFLWELAKSEEHFYDFVTLGYLAANRAKCGSECAMRWLNQYTAPNGDFVLVDDEHRIALREKVPK